MKKVGVPVTNDQLIAAIERKWESRTPAMTDHAIANGFCGEKSARLDKESLKKTSTLELSMFLNRLSGEK